MALCYLYEGKYQALARRSQDQVGDLATMVEESVLGIRILKAFGRSGHLSRRFLAQARELRATEIGKARVLSKLWAVIIAMPEIAFGLTLFLGLQQVADGDLSAGALVAFFGVALGLRWPIDSIGWLLAMSNDAASATQRYFEVMDAPLTVTSPQQPRADPDARPAAGCSSPASGSGSPTRRPPRPTCCAVSTSRSSPVKPWRWSARPDPARPR